MQTWDQILPSKSTVSSNVYKRLRKLQVSEPITLPDYSSAAIGRAKKVKLAETHSSVSKYVPIVFDPNVAITPQNFGYVPRADLAAEPLTDEPVAAVTILDDKLNRLLTSAIMTKAGSRSALLKDLPAAQEITASKASQLKREAHRIIIQDSAAKRRIRAIKSKTAKKIHRLENLKKQARVLDFLESEDPETAAEMKAKLEEKRASLRSLKEHKARKRWARIAAKFHGGQINSVISQSFDDAKQYKNLVSKLAGGKSTEPGEGSGSESSDSDDDSDWEDTPESSQQRREKIIRRAESKIASILSETGEIELEKGVGAMPFMKLARKKNLEKEKLINEEYIRLLEDGHLAKDAAILAKQRFTDAFDSNFEDVQDLDEADEEFIQKKMAAAMAAEDKKVLKKSKTKRDKGWTEAESKKHKTGGSEAKKVTFADVISVQRPLSATDKLNFGIKISAPVTNLNSQELTSVEIDAAKFDASRIDLKDAVEAFDNENDVLVGDATSGLTDDSALVKAAFASESVDEAEREWNEKLAQEAMDKAEAEEASKPKGKEWWIKVPFILCSAAVLGWGAWTGEGTEVAEAKVKVMRPISAQQKIPSFVFDDSSSKKFESKYDVEPRSTWPFSSKDEWKKKTLGTPCGPEWVPKGSFQKQCEPLMNVRAGAVIASLQWKPKSQTPRRLV